MFSTRTQANPVTDEDVETGELKARVERTFKVLDLNSGPIHRWFWKGLLALNLLLWSVVLCAAFLWYVSAVLR